MTRVFLVPGAMSGDMVTLAGDDARHLTRVLRMGPGDRYIAIAGGVEYSVELTTVTRDLAVGRVVGQAPAGGEPPLKLTLVQGLAKGEKMEFVIQKGTELGVSRFIPVMTERSVVQLTEKKASDRIERWQRIAREAAEQCRRGAVPEVAPLASWEEALKQATAADLKLVPWEEENALGLKAALERLRNAGPSREPLRIAIFIGPEGGLTSGEAALARARGALLVTLGPRILRTETAGLAVVASIMYEFGDLGNPGLVRHHGSM